MRQEKVEFGDWQTPLPLAEAALGVIARLGRVPATVLEPTCGEGAFLVASARKFLSADLVGFEVNQTYVDTARAAVPPQARIEVADFFNVDWDRELAGLRRPLLVTGNPPWVTSAQLGALRSANLPEKRNFKGLSGYDALTGKSNFDVSEWMILRLLEALQGQDATIALLCKSAVARRVVEFIGKRRLGVRPGGLWRIDAMAHFQASVDAVLFIVSADGRCEADARWPVYPTLDAEKPESWLAVIDGTIVADGDGYLRTRQLVGNCDPEWRSGVKHDCSRVMELQRDGSRWINGLGEDVNVEDDRIYPLLKSSDVANNRLVSTRAMIVPQQTLGQDTLALKDQAPRTWAYLSKHRTLLDARKSSIYRGQPPFAIFGIGSYTFAPWKVAISGLYKRHNFALVGPQAGRPVLLDDTCYFLSFDDEVAARAAVAALASPLAKDFLSARVFWDAKRPISKAVLQTLDLRALQLALGQHVPRTRRGTQQLLAL